MFKNIKYIDPKLFQEDGQPRYNIDLAPTDWKSFTSFTDRDKTIVGYNDKSNSGSIEYSVIYNDENELFNTDGTVKYDKVYGVSFVSETSHDDASTIDNAIDFVSEQVNGSVTFTSTGDNYIRFYKFKMLAGVTYTFSRTTTYDDQVWFYDENKQDDNGNYDSIYSFEKKFDRDTVAYIEIAPYNRNMYWGGTGDTTLSISPIPLAADIEQFIKSERAVSFSGDMFLFGQTPLTYSFWYYKGDNASGPLVSLIDKGVTKFCLYIENGLMYLYDGVTSVNIATISDSFFNKKGISSPLHICFSYDFENSFCSIFLDGIYSYGEVVAIDLTCDMLLFGSSTVENINPSLDGTIKWIRTYNRVLGDLEIRSLYSEFDNCPGDGSSWTKAYGSIPNTIQEDTAYIIRRYSDETKTFIQDCNVDINKFGLFACPNSVSAVNINIPKNILSCPWIGERGSVVVEQYNDNSKMQSNTISYFIADDIEITKNTTSSIYMIQFSCSNINSLFSFNSCRFSSNGCKIDINNSYNNNAGKYLFCSGTIGDFIMKNCTIVNTRIDCDAFKIVNCKNVLLRDLDVYTAPSSGAYNNSCFGFIGGNESNCYDDFWSYMNTSSVGSIDMKNVTMTIRPNENSQTSGLILATGCSRATIDNVNIVQGNSLSSDISNILSYNGLFNIGWVYDYSVKNITIELPNAVAVSCWPIMCMFLTESEEAPSVSNGKETRRNISDINITIGNSASGANTAEERDYFSTSEIARYFPRYSVFSVISNDDPSHGVHLVKNCNVYAPRCAAIAFRGVFGEIGNINGKIRVNNSRIDVEDFTSIYNSNIMSIWYNGEINVNNLNISNPVGNNLIAYNTSSNGNISSHVYINNSNCQIQKNSFNKSGGGENNAFVYCPNTTINGGFSMNGMSHTIIPVDVHRNNGHGISLRLHKNGTQENAFRFPPRPYEGIGYNLTSGEWMMTIHFSEAESMFGKTYKDFLDELWIEVVTSEQVYSSKIDGQWSEDDDMWNYLVLKPFKFTLKFGLQQDEKVFVRVYYNMDTHANGGLFLDPKIDWEQL